MVIQCKNLISLYILPDQRRGNLLVLHILANNFPTKPKKPTFKKKLVLWRILTIFLASMVLCHYLSNFLKD